MPPPLPETSALSPSNIPAERTGVMSSVDNSDHVESQGADLQAAVPAVPPVTSNEESAGADGDEDDTSESDSNSDSSTSTETPDTNSSHQSVNQDSGSVAPIPVASAEEASTSNSSSGEGQASGENAPASAAAIPLPPLEPDNIPEWVKYEEDTSEPNEEEQREMRARSHEDSAARVDEMDKLVFDDQHQEALDDPEYRPCKKIRLSWTIQGVRGTRENPNRARIMTSPSALVDGKYWSLKFFPRGNKSRTSMAVHVRCSPKQPGNPTKDLKGTFTCWTCSVEEKLSEAQPCTDIQLKSKEPKQAPETVTTSGTQEPATASEAPGQPPDLDNQTQETAAVHDPAEDDTEEGDTNHRRDTLSQKTDDVEGENFRVSAQLGLVVYNPAEPRTCVISALSHQFCPHNDDWGWENAVPDWEDIHQRQHGQHQALLRNDTLSIDVYVKIYDDKTEALFWHESAGERQWDAKGLTGFFPFGTRPLYHSPATAGLSALLLLAPFRKLVESIDAGVWRRNSSLAPRPLIAHLQQVLFQMRYMKKDELYVHIDHVLHEVTRNGESFDTVKTFWQALRRGIENEVQYDKDTVTQLDSIMGRPEVLKILPLLPVKDTRDIQAAIDQACPILSRNTVLPDLLSLELARQSFDTTQRQWRLHDDRVRLSERIDLGKHVDGASQYTLYGFIVHEGERTSGKFFSTLRPHGVGGKWLSFSDGNGNKILSRTRQQLERYEGREGSALKKVPTPREVIHTVLYIRSDKVDLYLTGMLEPYKLPCWLKPTLEEPYQDKPEYFELAEEEDKKKPVVVEIFWDESVAGQKGKQDLYTLQSNEKARRKDFRQVISAQPDAKIALLQQKLAEILDVEYEAIKLWSMKYNRLGSVSKGYMYVLPPDAVVASCLSTSCALQLWLSTSAEKIEKAEKEKADFSLAKNFVKLDGLYVEIPPKPESSGHGLPDSLDLMMGENDIFDVDAARAAKDGEGATIEEADTSAETTADSAEADADADAIEDSVEPTEAVSTSASAVESSEIDEEQEMIQAAIAASLADLPVVPDTIVTSSEGAHPAAQTESGTTSEETHPQTSNTDSIGTDAESSEMSSPAVVRDENVQSGSDTVGVIPPPSLMDLVQQSGIFVPITSADGEALSVEDAALIQTMIAADLAAEERASSSISRARRIINELIEESTEQVAAERRPTPPRPRVVDVYGFLHIFDPSEQDLTAHGTFSVPRDSVVSDLVIRQLGYGSEEKFQLWKREGTFRTKNISLESTFADCDLSDTCEIIVGPVLTKKEREELEGEAKFTDPGQLMRFMTLSSRKHPTAALTTTEAISLNEFGSEYYHGPLVRGQRHGEECKIITNGGDQYEGPLICGQKSGARGKMIYQNGDVYIGSWLKNERHGQGEFTEARTGNKYVGGFEHDKRWGKGTTYWEMADQQAALCQVCYFEEVDALFYRCGHVVACYDCARQCMQNDGICPVCRKNVEAVVKMYRS